MKYLQCIVTKDVAGQSLLRVNGIKLFKHEQFEPKSSQRVGWAIRNGMLCVIYIFGENVIEIVCRALMPTSIIEYWKMQMVSKKMHDLAKG